IHCSISNIISQRSPVERRLKSAELYQVSSVLTPMMRTDIAKERAIASMQKFLYLVLHCLRQKFSYNLKSASGSAIDCCLQIFVALCPFLCPKHIFQHAVKLEDSPLYSLIQFLRASHFMANSVKECCCPVSMREVDSIQHIEWLLMPIESEKYIPA